VILVAGKWGGQAPMTGLLVALLAAIAFAAYTVASKSLFQALPLFDVLVGTSVWGSLFLWIYVLVTGQAVQVVEALAPLSVAGWLQFLYIVAVVSTLAYVLYGYGLRNAPAGIASAVTFYPQALFAALIQWVWMGIVPGAITLVSAVFILGGTLLMRLKPKGRQASADSPTPICENGQR
jgi:drug/metabolite transporter (DMT)-like permease